MLQVVIVVVIVIVMIAAITGADAVLHAVRGGQGTSVLLPDGTGRRRAPGIPLQEFVDREPVLVYRIRWYVLHLRALMQMRVGVRVMQMLTVMRHQRGSLPQVSAGSGMQNGRRRLEPGDRHGRRRWQRESRY